MEVKMAKCTERAYWGYIGDYIGIMEKKMETTIVSWGYISLLWSVTFHFCHI